MLIVFYSALDTKLVTCFWNLQPHLPSGVTFVLLLFLARDALSTISTKWWIRITYVNLPDAWLPLSQKKMVFETKP